jgi:hypothetical protein
VQREPPPVPPVPIALVEYLEAMFPDQAPTLSMTEKEVWFHAGATSPARHLRSILLNQQDNILEKPIVLPH